MDSFFSVTRDLQIKGLIIESHPLSMESIPSRNTVKTEMEDNDHIPGPSSQNEPSIFLCDQCDSSFVSKATLQHHINSRHLKIHFYVKLAILKHTMMQL